MTPKLVGVVFAIGLLSPAWADVTGSVTMSAGLTLDLDTGAIGGGPTGDLRYTGFGAFLDPFGNGTFLAIVGQGGSGVFDAMNDFSLSNLTTYSKAPIPDRLLTPGLILAARTKSGRYSKLLVQANNNFGVVVLTFQTFTQVPVITLVQNNFGRTLPTHPLVPGSVFFVTGRNLSTVDDGQTLRSSAAPGLLNTVSGVTVTVTVNGTSFNCPLYYLSPGQINAVLPGNTALGQGTIRVTNNQQTSPAFDVTIAQSGFGIINYNGTLAATYDTNNALITRFNAANPGQTIVIWGTGVGADPANDDRLFPQKTNDLANLPMQVLVGGRPATIRYRGRSQFPGVDQVVVTLPANAPTGCYVPLMVITGEITSNGVTIPVAASGKTCSDPGDPLTPARLQNLSAQASVRTGTLSVRRFVRVGSNQPATEGVNGVFFSATGFGAVAGNDEVSLGQCLVRGVVDQPALTTTPLDAGAAVQVDRAGASLLLTRAQNSSTTRYEATVPPGFVPAAGGIFGFSNGVGGPGGLRFDTNLHLPLNFSWTNAGSLAQVDPRGATVTWTGGTTAPGDSGSTWVEITGSSRAGTGNSFFVCRVPTSAGQFTIPAYILSAQPRSNGSLSVAARSRYVPSSSPLDLFSLEGSVEFAIDVRF